MRTRLPAIKVGAFVLAALTGASAAAAEGVPLTAEQLDQVTAGYGYVLLLRWAGEEGYGHVYRIPPDTYPDAESAIMNAEDSAMSIGSQCEGGCWTDYKIIVTGTGPYK